MLVADTRFLPIELDVPTGAELASQADAVSVVHEPTHAPSLASTGVMRAGIPVKNIEASRWNPQ